MTGSRWQFGIDVGGTFTDCVAVAPDGHTHVVKVLSSGVTKGELVASVAENIWRTTLRHPTPDFFRGQVWTTYDHQGTVVATGRILASQADGTLVFEPSPTGPAGTRIELTSGEEAPVLAIRAVLGLHIDVLIPPVNVRLGTTRGTNALLTRSGAKTGFLTTRGFRDVLLIANQDRPRLFDLEIQKPVPLFAAVEEVDERFAADGAPLQAPQAAQVEAALLRLRDAGCESLAICLLHAFANPAHEEFVAAIAEGVGFRRISVSNRLSPLIKLVSRGDTTVMDAYLNPILQDYVATLQTQLPGSELRFMTSAGGLVSAARFTGKECVLSGPAGGVIGLARATERAGFPRCIGFDMGGTSTDVARYDGRYEFEYETMKAGVRIVTPMLSIETVAAGGGSLCGFDGVKLYVGPQSAGAVPGPACYGRGGPLTVTDCNVFLGRIPVDRFPFPLDVAAIRQRLEALCADLASAAFGKAYTPQELATGFLEIANAAMARAIRKVSVTRGYDPTEYVLMPFGGAGGQHACAVARLLGMRRILVHPLAGVLSAVGIGQADVRRSGSVAVLAPWNAATWERCQPQVQQLIATAIAELQAEGVLPARIQPATLTLDLRYQGVDSPLSITTPADGDWAAAYAAKHRQLYGYDRPGRALELVAIRIEVVGQTTSPATRERVESTTTGRMLTGDIHDGAAFPVIFRETLQPGDRLNGPVIVAEPTSTLVIDEGFCAVVLGEGEVLIEDREDASGVSAGAKAQNTGNMIEVDPVQLELFHHTFGSIAEQMGLTLQQTSVSTNVKERLDFSCAIFDPRGGLVVNAPHIPVHLGAMSETVRCILRDNPDLAPGDVFVTNDPYRGGSHLPDVTVVTPVHDPVTGQLLFFTASRAITPRLAALSPAACLLSRKIWGKKGC
jgi:5-oxoprolinase (ATP-hydrolysing)